MEKILVYGMTDNPGGIESYLLSVLEIFKNDDVHFDFVTDFPAVSDPDALKRYGAVVHYIPPKGKGLVKHWKELCTLLKAHPEYQKIYFNILDAGAVFSMVIPWIYRREIIAHSHNGATDKERLHNLCRPWLRMMTDKFVACSHLAASFMFGNNIEKYKKVEIVPNAIECSKFKYNSEIRKEKRNELDIQQNYVILHVGRLTRQKNPKGVIDIFQQLSMLDDSALLLSVGTGDQEEIIKDYISAKGLTKKVKLLGVRNDVAEIMQAADVFLLPSLYEGFPIVCVEAQAAGLPCAISDTITEEVDLSGRVKFLALDRDYKEWAAELMPLKDFPRQSSIQQLIDAGYDNEHSETRKNILKRIFK